jgi:putative SOS response-associated peptidase YedK
VILHPQEYDIWLDRDMNDPEKLKHYYQPYPAGLMEMFPVSPKVNSPKIDSPDLIKPVSEQ